MSFSAHRWLPALYLYLIFFLLYPSTGYAQHRYALSPAKDIPLLSMGVAGTTASILLRNKHKPLTADDLGKLNATDIFAIDQSATHYYGRNARIASDVLLTTSYIFPLATLLLKDVRSESNTIGMLLLETVLINEALTGVTKAVVRRPRPFTYNQDVPENIRTGSESTFSFFSGHTSYTAALSFFSAKVISDHTDNHTLKAIAWTGAALWPAATGFFRYKAGLHFPTDVITGYIVGATVGYMVPQLHKKKEKTQSSTVTPSLQVGPGMVRITLVF